MSEKYLMAIDAGTGSVRAVIFDVKGNQIECVQQEWEHLEDPKYPGSMNFDWEKNWDYARRCIAGVMEKSHINNADIVAVSTTCMREGIILYDKTGKEIWACANVDARSTDEVVQLKKKSLSLEHELYLETGQTYSLSALPRILWVKNNLPEVYENIASIGMFNDWLIYKMSGKLVVEPSNGSTSGLFSLTKRTWDKTIAERCGLKSDIFPPVQECGTLVSHVSKEGAKETGLKEGTPIIVGGGDAQLGTIGVGVTEANEAAVFGGTFWQYEYNTASGSISDDCDIRVNCHVQPNLWQYEALAFKPGLMMRWYRDGFCTEEQKEAAAQGKDVYALMDERAEKIPVGSNGMFCTFSDVMNFSAWRHAAPTFTNFTFEAELFNKYTFYRSILESTALITYGHMQLVASKGGGMPSAVTFGGGAAKSRLWAQIVCDALGVPLRIPVVKEATALGAAMLAATGVGIYSSIKEAAAMMVKIETTLQPNMEHHKKYMEMYKIWRDIYDAQLSLSDRGITQYMWAAPGITGK